MSEIITGTLRRIRTRKASRDWARDMADRLAEEAGIKPVRYWPERVYVAGDTLGSTGKPSVWSVRGHEDCFDGIPDGTRVRFKATVSRWDNGIGGTCSRISGVEVMPHDVPLDGAS
jgi:hypothetical protein